jgi:hypothetical protein
MSNYETTLLYRMGRETGAGYVISEIEKAADYYHSMFLEPDDEFRKTQWLTALDILERVMDLEEGSLAEKHTDECGCLLDQVSLGE